MRFSRIMAAAVLVSGLAYAGAANAHTVTFAWTDNGDGTVTLWNEHWHGNQIYPCSEGIQCSDNGGLTISGDGSGSPGSVGLNAYTVQWAGTVNDTDRDDMVADGTLTGYTSDGLDSGGGSWDDWLFTEDLVIGDGMWWFFTGTTCCIDTMAEPVLVTLTGIGSVDPGTGPGGVADPSAVPAPATLPLLGTGLALLAFLGARRRRMS